MTDQDASAPECVPLDSGNDAALAAEPLASEHTANFPQLLAQLGISLLVTTYQAGRLIVVRNDAGQLNTHFRVYNSQP